MVKEISLTFVTGYDFRNLNLVRFSHLTNKTPESALFLYICLSSVTRRGSLKQNSDNESLLALHGVRN